MTATPICLKGTRLAGPTMATSYIIRLPITGEHRLTSPILTKFSESTWFERIQGFPCGRATGAIRDVAKKDLTEVTTVQNDRECWSHVVPLFSRGRSM